MCIDIQHVYLYNVCRIGIIHGLLLLLKWEPGGGDIDSLLDNIVPTLISRTPDAGMHFMLHHAFQHPSPISGSRPWVHALIWLQNHKTDIDDTQSKISLYAKHNTPIGPYLIPIY